MEKTELSSEERRIINEQKRQARKKKNKILRAIRKGIWEDGFTEQFCYPKPYTVCVIATNTAPPYYGVGVAKWNPNDNNDPKWRYSKKSGEKFARPKAVANLAEEIYATYSEEDKQRVEWMDETKKFIEAMSPVLTFDMGVLTKSSLTAAEALNPCP